MFSKIDKKIFFLRALLLNGYIGLNTIFFGIILFPLIFINKNLLINFSKLWADSILFATKHICGLSYKLEGEIPTNGAIIASKHQSMFEVLVFLSILPKSSFVLKQELLKIPIFGNYLKLLKMIPINRSSGRDSINNIIQGAKTTIAENRHLIIFPEGTRVVYGENTKCKSGIAFLQKEQIADIYPVILDSGKFWPKNPLKIVPGIVKIKFLPVINKTIPHKEIVPLLDKILDSEF